MVGQAGRMGGARAFQASDDDADEVVRCAGFAGFAFNMQTECFTSVVKLRLAHLQAGRGGAVHTRR